jgi:hypothetical protein
MYSSTLSLTSVLDGVGGQRNAPAALPLRKSRDQWCSRLVGSQGQSGRKRNISPYRDSIPIPLSPSESLYRLRHPGPRHKCIFMAKYGVVV